MKSFRINFLAKSNRITSVQLIFFGYLLFICAMILLRNFNRGNSIFNLIGGIPHSDKAGHFFLFGLLTFFMSLAWKHRTFQLMTVRIALAPVIIFIATFMEECSQIILEFRTFSVFDLLANILGIVCFGFLAIWFTKKKILKIDL